MYTEAIYFQYLLNTGEVPYRFPLYFKEGLEQTCFNLSMLTINTTSFIWEWLAVLCSQVLEVQYLTNRIYNKCIIKFTSFQNISRDARLPSDPLSSQPWHCRVSSIESFALEMINDAWVLFTNEEITNLIRGPARDPRFPNITILFLFQPQRWCNL